MIAKRAAGRMRGDEWSFAEGEDVVESFVADVRDVHHHAEAIHFAR